jgi:hypothetical protein
MVKENGMQIQHNAVSALIEVPVRRIGSKQNELKNFVYGC